MSWLRTEQLTEKGKRAIWLNKWPQENAWLKRAIANYQGLWLLLVPKKWLSGSRSFTFAATLLPIQYTNHIHSDHINRRCDLGSNSKAYPRPISPLNVKSSISSHKRTPGSNEQKYKTLDMVKNWLRVKSRQNVPGVSTRVTLAPSQWNNNTRQLSERPSNEIHKYSISGHKTERLAQTSNMKTQIFNKWPQENAWLKRAISEIHKYSISGHKRTPGSNEQ